MTTIALLLAAAVVGWNGLVEDGHLAGRPASAGYLRGKVVLVDSRDYGARGVEIGAHLERMGDIWRSYKSKQFVLLGNHLGESMMKAESVAKAAGVSYPVYTNVVIDVRSVRMPKGTNTVAQTATTNDFIIAATTNKFCVIDAAGNVRYVGGDDRKATELVVLALTDEQVPPDAETYRKLLDYELVNLPGKALVRFEEFRKRFPEAAWDYQAAAEALKTREECVRLAKLEAFSRQAKDYNPKVKKGKRITRTAIEAKIATFKDLKESDDPMVVQEAKNCLADLVWAAAAMRK